MKPVRYRDGFDNRGGKDARFLDANTPGAPFLKIRRFDAATGSTTVAHKKGEFLEVTRTGALLEDGFYSLGRIGGEMVAVGSPMGAGRFARRGTTFTEDGVIDLTQIRVWGQGLGLTVHSELVGVFTDFDGKDCDAYEVKIYRTRNGRRFVEHLTYLAFAPYGYSTLFDMLPGEVYGPPGDRHFQAIFAYQGMKVDGQHFHAFVRDDGAALTHGDPPHLENQLAAFVSTHRLSPERYVMMCAYMRPQYSGSSVDAAASPGLVFFFSDDSGDHWAEASSTELFQEFFDTVQTLPVPFNGTIFNNAVNIAGFSAVPWGKTKMLAYVVVPYIEDPLTDPVLKAKVKLGIIDSAARTLMGTLTLFDGLPNAALAFWNGGCVGVEGGMVFVTRPLATVYTDIQDQHPVIHFTPDAVSVATLGPTPQPNFKTGQVSAISPHTIVMPMYDGEHSLYQSSDHGLTWTKRAVLSDAAPVPVSDLGQFQLADFGALTFLRLNGRPANSTPGTPWASDSRIEAPLL